MTGSSRRLPDRVRSIDLVALAVGLVAVVTYALHGVQGRFPRDQAVYAYGGQQVLDGEPPYIGILNRAGPLAHLIPALGAGIARLGGKDDLLGMRLLYMLIAVATVVVVYYVGRDAFGSKLVGLVGAGAMLSFEGFIELAAYGPREKTPMVLFIACALWALTHRRWFLAGLCVSLATLVLQIAFFPAIAAVLVGLALQPRATWVRGLIGVVLGGAVPVLVLSIYFLAEGAWRNFLDAFVLLNAAHSPPNPLLERLPRVWATLQAGYGPSLWGLLVGLVALLLLVPPAIQRRRRHGDGGSATLLACTAGAVAVVLWSLLDYDSWPDTFPLLPFAAVGVGALVAEVARHVPRVATVGLAAVTVGLSLILALTYSVTERDDRLLVQRSSTRAVLGVLPDDARLLSLEAPQPLVLSGRTNPTRHQMFSTGLSNHVDDTWPGGFDGFLQWIRQEQFEVIALGDRQARRQMPDRDERWIQWLRDDYRKIGSTLDWTWMAHESLGQDTIAALRRAERRSR